MKESDFNTQSPPRPADLELRTQALLDAFDSRILVMDGATGTAMQSAALTAQDFGGPELEGCNENLCRTRPDVVDMVHERYLRAGADIIETNTFGATPLVLDEYKLGEDAFLLNQLAAQLARTAAARHSTAERVRFVCGSIGPTTRAISVTGGITFDELVWNFYVQALGLMAGGADYLLLETCQDTRNIKAGLIGIDRAFEQAGWSLPVAVSATIETMGTMLAGQDAESLAVSLMHRDLLYVGLNCATGPELMTDHLRTLSELVKTRVALVPNAGLPDEEGCYHEGPAVFTEVFSRFLDAGWLNLVGGCCGTTDLHVTALRELVAGRAPRLAPTHHRALLSGLETVELTDDNRPLLVGERTNVLGSARFKKLIAAGDYEAAAEIGKHQVNAAGQVLDVCLQDPDRDEQADMDRFLDRLVRRVKVPLMIDSTDAAVLEQSLKWCQGKAVINSINLEDGLHRFEQVMPLVRRYGAAVVVGCIDEAGMAVSVERKVEIARRSYALLTERYGLAPEDIWWDALVFPCGTGDEAYLGSAGLTVAGVKALKQAFPDTRTVLGVSNVSFGLPNAGREVLNSVFLYHCTKAGLDAALVNTQKLARYADIPEAERHLAETLIFLDPSDKAAGEAAVARFTAHFRGQSSRVKQGPSRSELPLDERLRRAIIEGSKEGLIDDLELARKDPRWPAPLELINGPLMEGMAEVGRLFNDNQLIVAEVLQSAEVMKAAVTHLEQFMERLEGSSRGKVLLATVKGDVHDIGKNLVDIILSNNGFEVINLGIKVPSEQLILAARAHKPDVIGLSGLLVKSAQQMVTTAADFKAAGIHVPLIVGGAALTRRFTSLKIAPEYGGLCAYAKDAMSGLNLVERLTDQSKIAGVAAEVAQLAAQDTERAAQAQATSTTRSARQPIRRDLVAPRPADLLEHRQQLDLDEVWPLINPQMLYGKHLGYRGSISKAREAGDEKLAKLEALMEELKGVARGGGMQASAIWRFFPARAEGQTLILIDPDTGAEATRWALPRQEGDDGHCLADYVLDSDHVGLLVTTSGFGVRERVQAFKNAGEYVRSHAWGALALETAEAAAELVHARMRAAWGFADETTRADDLLKTRYRGRRYSFGYPACPDLSMQQGLWRALRPESIGVNLTEGDMMDPEASVSALVFHHPDATYFGV